MNTRKGISIPHALEFAEKSLQGDQTFIDFTDPIVVANQLKRVREHYKLSQVEFSETFGIPVSNIKNWEQPIRNKRPDSVARLLLKMIISDPSTVANLVESVRIQEASSSKKSRAAIV